MESKKRIFHAKFYIIFVSLLCCVSGFSQSVTVSGIVKDAKTEEALPFVAVSFVNSTIGTSTDNQGSFSVTNKKGMMSLKVSSMGYKDKIIALKSDKTSDLLVLLESAEIQLNDVVVYKGRQRYSKRENPAVDFMREVIARKEFNNITNKSNYKTERYEKFTTYLDKFNSNNGIFKSSFFSSYIDSSEINGKKVLALSVKETLSDLNYRKVPHAYKELVKAKREEGIWRDFDESTSQNMQELFRDINLYDNTIDLFYTKFVSPLSSLMALSMYKYFIEDTVVVDNVPCLKMAFFPFNQESLGFKGTMYFTVDGKYALKKAELLIPNKANLNFAKNLTINQNYKQMSDSSWVLSDENLQVNLYLFTGIPELLIQRVRSYRDYNFDYQGNDIFRTSEMDLFENEKEVKKSDEYWVANRHIPLKAREEDGGIKKMLEELRRHPLYKTIVRTSDFFASGYFVAGGNKDESKFNIGPLGSIVSKNEIEGLHVRLGGTTTANLSNQIFASGYLAYGIYDERLKYDAKLSYSFYPKKYHENEFPRDKISVQYNYDLYGPGAVFQEDKDNFFTAWRVGHPITKMSYLRRAIVSYEKDLNFNFYVKTWLKHQIDEPTGTLSYRLNDNGTIRELNDLTTFEWGAKVDYRLGGRPFDGRNSQMDLARRTTEFSLSHYMGIKNILGSEYNYQRTEFSLKSRIQMSAFGYTDTKLKFGKTWTKTPFPMLHIPNAYQSIMLQPDAFQLMNAMEFVTDQYVSLNATYHLNGLLFNRIPILNLLKLREVVSINGILGGLTDRNNPLKTQGLFELPNGTKPLGSTPYLEVGIGIENIFKVFRIDYYRRLNYLEPNTRKNGFLISYGFTF